MLSISVLDELNIWRPCLQMQEGKAWMTQLLSVACLSLAAKMEETAVPQSLDLQVSTKLCTGLRIVFV